MLWRVHWHYVSCVSYSVTTRKKKFCLDPEWKHAQMHLEEFKKRSAPTTLEPETTKEMKTNVSSTTLKPTTIWVWNPRNDQRSYLLLSCVLNCCRTLIINDDHTEMFLVFLFGCFLWEKPSTVTESFKCLFVIAPPFTIKALFLYALKPTESLSELVGVTATALFRAAVSHEDMHPCYNNVMLWQTSPS